MNAALKIPILDIRSQKVILDADLACLYGVSTKALNQAMRRNRKRFPADFVFQLSVGDFVALRLQDASNNLNRSQIVTGSQKHRDPRFLPWAFTEHGALMAANVLNSAEAVKMSVYIIRAFIKIREELATNTAILKRLAEIDKTLLVHDKALRDVYQKLLPLLSPPADPPKPKIGFYP